MYFLLHPLTLRNNTRICIFVCRICIKLIIALMKLSFPRIYDSVDAAVFILNSTIIASI